MSKPSKTHISVVISTTVFWVFLIQFLVSMLQSNGYDASNSDFDTPGNLRTAADRFLSSLAVEQPHSDGREAAMRSTEAWKELETNLDGYATRLELMQGADRKRQLGLSLVYAASAFAMFICTIIQQWKPEPLRLWHRRPPSA